MMVPVWPGGTMCRLWCRFGYSLLQAGGSGGPRRMMPIWHTQLLS